MESRRREPSVYPVVLTAIVFLSISAVVLVLAITLSWDERVAQWVAAVGTWVGGIFTGSAFLFTAYQLNFDARVHHAEQQRRVNDIKETAKSCAFRIGLGTSQSLPGGVKGFKSVEIRFNNRTNRNVQDIAVTFDGREVAHAEAVRTSCEPSVVGIGVRG